MGQVTSADTESTVSAPVTAVSLTTGHSAADSGDTDRPECSATDRGSAADQSERSMELTPAVLPATGDNSSQLSADPTETAGDVEYLEAGKAGSESALGAEMKGIAQAEGCSDIVHQGDSVASGEELVSTSDAAVVSKTAAAVDADSETGTDEAHLGDGDMASDRPENMAGYGPSISDKSDDAASAVCSVEAPVCEPSISDKSEEVAVSGPSAVSTTEASISGPSVSDKPEDAAVSGPPTASTGGAAKSSLDDDSSHDFLALTYLVHPPDGAAFSRPYVDDFWTSRWARMDAEIRRMLRKSSRLASDVITLDSSSSSSSSDYDSSEYADDDDYEDSVASNSPIFVCEKPSSSAAAAADADDAEKDSSNEVVLDENSSNAIVVGDEDDNDDDEADDDGCVENDEIDEILFSRESNEGDAEADSSIVVCDGDSSALGWSGPVSGMDEDLVTAEQDSDPAPANSSDSVSELESASTTAAPETRAAKLANGCTGVADAVDKPGRAAAEAGRTQDAEAGRTQDADVQNGTCGGGVDTAD